jgi:hypothetical protein
MLYGILIEHESDDEAALRRYCGLSNRISMWPDVFTTRFVHHKSARLEFADMLGIFDFEHNPSSHDACFSWNRGLHQMQYSRLSKRQASVVLQRNADSHVEQTNGR